MTQLNVTPDRLDHTPAALVRALDGRIAYWSPAMEDRYGFTAEEAVGQMSYQLLRTTSWREFGEIQAVLADRNAWDGGLIHQRADGQPVMTANHWHFHRQTNDCETLVTELHSDIVAAGTDAACQLADVVTTIAQELSQPLTALGGYIGGVRRALQPAWLDKVQLDRGITEAITQLARTTEALHRLRTLGTGLRDPRLHQMHARMTAAFVRAERIMQKSRDVAKDTTAILTRTVLARAGRQDVTDARPVQRAVVLKNIRLFQYLLQQHGHNNSDARTEGALRQLLAQENAQLAALD